MDKAYQDIINIISNKPQSEHVAWTKIYQVAQQTGNPKEAYAELQMALTYHMTTNAQIVKWMSDEARYQMCFNEDVSNNTMHNFIQNINAVYDNARIKDVKPSKKGHPLDKLANGLAGLLEIRQEPGLSGASSNQDDQLSEATQLVIKETIAKMSPQDSVQPKKEQMRHILITELVYRPDDVLHSIKWPDNAIHYVTWADVTTYLEQHWQYNNRVSDMLINA